MRRFLVAAIAVVAIGVVASLLYRRTQTPRAVPAPATASKPAAPVPEEITLNGTVQPAHVVGVPAPIDGTIDQFLAEVGQHVSQGEVLARIQNPKLAGAVQAARSDAQQAQAHLNQLESGLIAARLEVSRTGAEATRVKLQLDQAQKTFEKQQMMFREGITARLVYEKAEQEYNALKAQSLKLASDAKAAADRVESITKELDPARKAVAQKTNDLEDTEAELAAGEADSPADGVVIARRGKEGEPVTTAVTDLLQIAADPPSWEVMAPVDPQTAPRIHAGQAAELQIAGVPAVAGTVREMKNGQVFIDVANGPAIKAGMAATVKLH